MTRTNCRQSYNNMNVKTYSALLLSLCLYTAHHTAHLQADFTRYTVWERNIPSEARDNILFVVVRVIIKRLIMQKSKQMILLRYLNKEIALLIVLCLKIWLTMKAHVHMPSGQLGYTYIPCEGQQSLDTILNKVNSLGNRSQAKL